MQIESISDFKTALRKGPYAWPGGYPLYFLMSDGESLSYIAAWENLKLIMQAIKDKDRQSGWLPVAVEVNWESSDLYCSHTGKPIPSAYGED